MAAVRQSAEEPIVDELLGKLREKSDAEHISVNDVARAIGVSRMHAHRMIRTAAPPIPSIATAKRIAKFLGLELEITLRNPKRKARR